MKLTLLLRLNYIVKLVNNFIIEKNQRWKNKSKRRWLPRLDAVAVLVKHANPCACFATSALRITMASKNHASTS